MLLKINGQKLRNAGMSWSKISYIKDLAQRVIDNEINLEKLVTLDDDEVIKELVKVKGITKVFGIKSPREKQMLKLSNKWIPFRSYACVALWRSLE